MIAWEYTGWFKMSRTNVCPIHGYQGAFELVRLGHFELARVLSRLGAIALTERANLVVVFCANCAKLGVHQ